MLRGRPVLRWTATLTLGSLLNLRPVSADLTSLRWRMVPTSQHTEAGSDVEMARLVSRVDQLEEEIAQIEAEIAQLREALTRRQQIGVETGLLAQRFAISPARAWSLLVRLSQNSHVKVREIAQAVIDAHCGRLDPVNREILS